MGVKNKEELSPLCYRGVEGFRLENRDFQLRIFSEIQIAVCTRSRLEQTGVGFWVRFDRFSSRFGFPSARPITSSDSQITLLAVCLRHGWHFLPQGRPLAWHRGRAGLGKVLEEATGGAAFSDAGRLWASFHPFSHLFSFF